MPRRLAVAAPVVGFAVAMVAGLAGRSGAERAEPPRTTMTTATHEVTATTAAATTPPASVATTTTAAVPAPAADEAEGWRHEVHVDDMTDEVRDFLLLVADDGSYTRGPALMLGCLADEPFGMFVVDDYIAAGSDDRIPMQVRFDDRQVRDRYGIETPGRDSVLIDMARHNWWWWEQLLDSRRLRVRITNYDDTTLGTMAFNVGGLAAAWSQLQDCDWPAN